VAVVAVAFPAAAAAGGLWITLPTSGRVVGATARWLPRSGSAPEQWMARIYFAGYFLNASAATEAFRTGMTEVAYTALAEQASQPSRNPKRDVWMAHGAYLVPVEPAEAKTHAMETYGASATEPMGDNLRAYMLAVRFRLGEMRAFELGGWEYAFAVDSAEKR
jgi:hypothetical protein